MEDSSGRLDVVARDPEQEICKIAPRFRAGKSKRAVERRVRIELHLRELELSAHLHRVRAEHLREAVVEIERLIDLVHAGDRDTHRERVERDVLDALELRCLDDDPRRGGPGHESLRCETDAPPTVRESDVVRIPRERRVKFVHRAVAHHGVITRRKELRAPQGQCVEARHVGAALLTRIRIIESIVVEEVVPRQQPEAAVAVHTVRKLVVAYGLREGARRKQILAAVGRRDVLQQTLSRR